MSAGRKRTQKLTVLLLKESVTSLASALRNPESLTCVSIRSDSGIDGELWYAKPKIKTPKWQEFVNALLDEKIQDLTAASVSAVLFVKAAGRIFAFTFGYGRNLLKPDCYEQGFGLRVALNVIHHERIRSLDVRTYEDLLVSTRKQSSRYTEVGTFGLDVTRDLLRAVTGRPTNENFASRVTGADSLTISAAITPNELAYKCEEIYEAYKSTHYQKYFAWIDHLSEVRDHQIIDTLDDKLIETLKSDDIGMIYLAPPEPLDWQRVDAFRIAGTRQKEYDDLDIYEYLEALGRRRYELTVDTLKRYCVSVRWLDSGHWQTKWPLYKCIVWETELDDKLYALVEGRWFTIEKEFANRVRAYVKALPSPSLNLPPPNPKEPEGKYNLRVAEMSNGNLVCLDGIYVKPEDAASEIEFCDLFSRQKQFIHVKKRGKSATLSHLFAQGTIAGRVFLQDAAVRDQLRSKLERAGKREFAAMIPDSGSRPRAHEYEIVFAIIGGHNTSVTSLPFFTQLNLMQNARLLQGLGYKVTCLCVAEKRPH